ITFFINRGVAQIGRALRSGRRGRGFESRHLDLKYAGITQSVEYLTRNEEAVGSNPISSFIRSVVKLRVVENRKS
ncbi:MAG: hypothetical protein K0S61_3974, partial [Anaerocolumna sp.]|nr:hypothetical protein [Anaerocolumna sp.]